MVFGENVHDHVWPQDTVGSDGPLGGKGPTILAIGWAECALATLLILLRIFTRYFMQKNAGWALFWTGFSWIFGFMSQVIITVVVHNSVRGFNSEWDVPQALVLTWVAIYLTFIAIAIGKCAVVAFILTLQGPTYQRSRYLLYVLASTNIIIGAICVLVLAFRCSPPHDIYVFKLLGHCTNNFPAAKGFAYFTGAWNAVTDLILALYPLFLFHNIRIARHTKAGICFVLSLGILASAAAIVKTRDFKFVNNTFKLNYQLYCMLTWAYTEMWCVLVTCSIPPLWPLAKRVLTRSRSTAHSAKEWVGSHTGSTDESKWSKKHQKFDTLALLGNDNETVLDSSRPLHSRGRSESLETNLPVSKHPQYPPRSTSRAVACCGRDTPTSIHEMQDGQRMTHSRGKGSIGTFLSRSNTGTLKSQRSERQPAEATESGRGILFSQDVVRPGIVVTREFTVETERTPEVPSSDVCQVGDFGIGKPMRHNWDDPSLV